jgi:hypothetical protein
VGYLIVIGLFLFISIMIYPLIYGGGGGSGGGGENRYHGFGNNTTEPQSGSDNELLTGAMSSLSVVSGAIFFCLDWELGRIL